MNCAMHTDVPAAAYCRTCGKPLCDPCKRDIHGVIYCQDCLAARVHDTMPAAAPAAAGPAAAPRPDIGANPVLAGFLGAIPFGVGAVYNGQYVKGLIHLIIFAFLVWGADNVGGGMDVLFGIAIPFFIVYQIVDAVRTAKARQLGQPLPDDLLGLSRLGPVTTDSRPPIGAVILIGLGVLFLLQNVGILSFHWLGRLWPLALIAAGIWVIYKRHFTGEEGPR